MIFVDLTTAQLQTINKSKAKLTELIRIIF